MQIVDLQALTDTELNGLQLAVDEEFARRRAVAIYIDTVVPGDQKITTPIPDDQVPEYKQPTGAHDAYPAGARIKWQGMIYESLLPANVWSPTDYPRGWKPITEALTAGQIAEYKQPTGAHDAYNIGDKVRFQGAIYESLINGNVWSPTDYPAGWKRVDG